MVSDNMPLRSDYKAPTIAHGADLPPRTILRSVKSTRIPRPSRESPESLSYDGPASSVYFLKETLQHFASITNGNCIVLDPAPSRDGHTVVDIFIANVGVLGSQLACI